MNAPAAPLVARLRAEIADLKRQLAAANAELPCGHHHSLRVSSVESDVSWCDLCDTRKQRNDAVLMEQEFQGKLAAAEEYKRDADTRQNHPHRNRRSKGNEMTPEQMREAAELRDVLIRNGFTECDIAACNCGSWHHRYGLPERWSEIKEALSDADVLDNSTGNLPLNAIKKLVRQRDDAREEGARLMQGAASEACLDVWQKADNVRPTYTQNAVSHGCLASSKAIHALSITEVLKGKP